MPIKDTHGRSIDYVRLAVTDRCNLRCSYCLPEGFTSFLPKKDLLSFEELFRLLEILSDMGVRKLRFTGGEPFVRQDLMGLIRKVAKAHLFDSVHITTNGVLTAPWIPELADLGIASMNISIDSIQQERFKQITGRDQLTAVLKTIELAVTHGIRTKLNTVVLSAHNTSELIDLVRFADQSNVDIRFIEEMPFNGTGEINADFWNYERILLSLQRELNLIPLPSYPGQTAMNYRLDNSNCVVGVIPAYSRTFCGSCNRLRISPKGEITTCLYAASEHSLFSLLRANSADADVRDLIEAAVAKKPVDGFVAERAMLEQQRSFATMASIGG
ncbi:MAG: hypothetical protein RL226_1847 [Bacteroidota bacterium]